MLKEKPRGSYLTSSDLFKLLSETNVGQTLHLSKIDFLAFKYNQEEARKFEITANYKKETVLVKGMPRTTESYGLVSVSHPDFNILNVYDMKDFLFKRVKR